MPGDSIFRRIRANSYFYAIEEGMDTARLPYVGRIQALCFNNPSLFKDMFGALSIEAKRLGGNGFQNVRFFYDMETDHLTLTVDVFRLSDSLCKLNQSLKPKGSVVVINPFYKGTLNVGKKKVETEAETFYSVPLAEKEKIKVWLDHNLDRFSIRSETDPSKTRYLIVQPGGPRNDFYFYFGLAGAALLYAVGGPQTAKIGEIDDNLAYVLMRIYKREEI